MSANIAKFCQLNDYILLEYEFNRDNSTSKLSSPKVVTTHLGVKEYYEEYPTAMGITNNVLPLTSIPTNAQRSNWFLDSTSYKTTYYSTFDTSISIPTTTYQLDTLRIHLVSGYNFDDAGGFLLQVRAQDNSLNLVDLANFTYAKQSQTLRSTVVKFATNTLFLGNRFYDKYIEFKVPSIQTLGAERKTSPYDTSLGQILLLMFILHTVQ